MSTAGQGARWLRIRRSIVMPENLIDRRAYATQVALDVLRACQVTRPPIDLDEVVNYLGNYTVVNARGVQVPVRGIEPRLIGHEPEQYWFDTQLDASKYDEYARIWVHPRLNPHERRQAFAHSLGHLLLHASVEDEQLTFSCAVRRDPTEDPREIEAKRFTDSLLLPLWLLEQEWRGGKDIPLLAEAFQTTIAAILHRLRIVRHE